MAKKQKNFNSQNSSIEKVALTAELDNSNNSNKQVVSAKALKQGWVKKYKSHRLIASLNNSKTLTQFGGGDWSH